MLANTNKSKNVFDIINASLLCRILAFAVMETIMTTAAGATGVSTVIGLGMLLDKLSTDARLSGPTTWRSRAMVLLASYFSLRKHIEMGFSTMGLFTFGIILADSPTVFVAEFIFALRVSSLSATLGRLFTAFILLRSCRPSVCDVSGRPFMLNYFIDNSRKSKQKNKKKKNVVSNNYIFFF